MLPAPISIVDESTMPTVATLHILHVFRPTLTFITVRLVTDTIPIKNIHVFAAFLTVP